MRRISKLQGVLVPILTPIMDDNSVDFEGAGKFASMMLASKYVDGLFAIGATSEFMNLSLDERIKLMEVFSEIPRGNKVITVNTGGLPFDQVIKLTKLAGEMKFDAAAITVPNEIEPKLQDIIEYFTGIAECGVPFTIYWTPIVKKHKPTFEIITELMKFNNFVGLKDSSRDMVEFTSIATAYGKEISIFQGVEMLHLTSLAVGSAGVVGGGLNLYPGLLSQITQSFESGNIEKARDLQLKVNKSWEVLAEGAAFRSICKQYWNRAGVLKGTHCRTGNNIKLENPGLATLKQLACF